MRPVVYQILKSCSSKYINFDYINFVLCDLCITELFVLSVLYFVNNDKINMFNQSYDQLSYSINEPKILLNDSTLYIFDTPYLDLIWILNALVTQNMNVVNRQ